MNSTKGPKRTTPSNTPPTEDAPRRDSPLADAGDPERVPAELQELANRVNLAADLVRSGSTRAVRVLPASIVAPFLQELTDATDRLRTVAAELAAESVTRSEV